jgi:hypothetical protein
LIKKVKIIIDTTDLTVLEEVMENLNDLAEANPNKTVELITGLADKLNEMSDNTVCCIFYLVFFYLIVHFTNRL